MKKLCSTIMLLAIMVAALSLPSCSNDDNDNNDNERVNPLVGVWVEETTNAYCHFIVFKSYGKGYAGEWDKGDRYENVVTFSYIYTGSEITIYMENGSSSVYQYSRSGNTLTLTKDGETIVYKGKGS